MPEQDCHTCKYWKSCQIAPEWFDYGQIRWCPYQVLFLLRHTETLKAGRWPTQDGGTISREGSRQFRAEASFVKPELVIAELETRLDRTGLTGKLLAAQAKAGETLETLDRDAWTALMYVKGFRRKALSFGDWRKMRTYRRKTTMTTEK